MDTLAYASPLPPRNRSGNVVLNFLVHHNPFYLLSALCMIAGCFALNSALETRSGELGKLLLLLATLQLYELMLIALGLYLILRHKLERDGRTLLLLNAVFLLDLTFLHSEAAATRLGTGMIVSALALLLACGKVGLVLYVLPGRFPRRAFTWAGLQLLALYAVPCALKWAEQRGAADGGTLIADLYAAWWVAGLLLVLFEAQRRLLPPDPSENEPGVRRGLIRLYSVAPFLSLLIHLGMLHWVYKIDFYLAHLAPVVLGLSVILARAAPQRLKRPDAAMLRVVLPGLAVLLSLHAPTALAFDPQIGNLALTPAKVMAAGAYLTYVYAFFLSQGLWFLLGGAVALLGLMFGPTLGQIVAGLDIALRGLVRGGQRIVPRTAVQWGVTAVVLSFALLALGAAVSLRRKPAE